MVPLTILQYNQIKCIVFNKVCLHVNEVDQSGPAFCNRSCFNNGAQYSMQQKLNCNKIADHKLNVWFLA